MQLALDNGFSVEVICFTFRNWSFEINKKILESFAEQAVKFHCIEAGREAGLPWVKAALKEKYYRLLAKAVKLKGSGLATAVSRRNYLLVKAVKKIKQADWVIGHNPGALFATKFAAKKLNAKAGFDVEDYHPGEGHDIKMQHLMKQLMQEVLPTMNYVSFAAPLIREAVKNDLGKEGTNWITVLNYFPSAEFIAPKIITGPLKLVWFSQYISAGRGLEYIIPLIKKFDREIELHLYGNLDEKFYEHHLKGVQNIIVHKPLPQKDLHLSLSNYDVGLALEITTDKNRELCLTNKLLSYMQAGLFVVASDIKAQTEFLKLNPKKGVISNVKNKNDLENQFYLLLNSKFLLRGHHKKRFYDVINNDWNQESIQLKIIWQTL